MITIPNLKLVGNRFIERKGIFLMRKYTKPDYAKKSLAFQYGAVSAYKDYSKNQFYEHCINDLGDLSKLDKYNPGYKEYLTLFRKDIWKEAERINDASRHRTIRLKERIRSIIENYDSTFVTLTFNDHILETTTFETRKRYVTRYLKSYGVPYVANVDYGKEHEREHYHAVIGTQTLNYKDWHSNGAVKGKKIVKKKNLDSDGDLKLAKYITKLTNHAIKETCKRNALIYSR